MEHSITDEGSYAFEFWGQLVLGTRVIWRTQSGILRVQLKQFVQLSIRCMGIKVR